MAHSLHEPGGCAGAEGTTREASGEHFWRTCKEFPADIVQQACSSSESSVRLEYQHEGRWQCIDIRTVEGGSRVIHITDRSEIHESRQQLRSEIEKRQAAESELEAKQEFLQAVLDNVETGIVACDETGALSCSTMQRELSMASRRPSPGRKNGRIFIASTILTVSLRFAPKTFRFSEHFRAKLWNELRW